MAATEKKYPDIAGFDLDAYQIALPLERLKLGVDNLRYDVRISPEFIASAGRVIFQLILKHAEASKPLLTQPKLNWHQEIARFKTTCSEVMTSAIDQAKSQQEEQIDYLAQVAMVKALLEQIDEQYGHAIQHFKSVVRKQEVSQRMASHTRLRQEVAGIIQHRNQVLQGVSDELFAYFIEVRRELDKLRVSNFGEDNLLPEELFANPLQQITYRPDDFFMMQHYVLLGHRLEDPLNYNAVLSVVKGFFNHLTANSETNGPRQADAYEKGPATENGIQINESESDRLIKSLGNIERLFDPAATKSRIQAKKKQKDDKTQIKRLKARARAQKRLLGGVYRQMAKEKMIRAIVAAYEMQPVVEKASPPLTPQEVLQYLVVPKTRKNIVRKIKRFNRYSGKHFAFSRLRAAARGIRRVPGRRKKKHLVQFLTDFARYHRDLGNYRLFRETADCIHLAADEKIVKLSRENHTLYEFLLSREQVRQTPPIINHAVIKADVRGSTEIIDQMKAKGLNPASNFSLNFFNPISNLLSIYGAEKVFIEGDAVILSIFEHENMPGRWYSVARACGMAVNMLMVVKRYNQLNRKNSLPRLDLGIGIGFSAGAPTFFYDGNTQIMISHAINVADRLSACDHALRKQFTRQRPPFNIYIYEIDTASLPAAQCFNNPALRYNVMGIELSPAGFEKLAEEIHLSRHEAHLPDLQDERFVLYSGKFPTTSKSYQRIVIREAPISVISAENFQVSRQTDRKYYEVCTHPRVYEYIKSKT
ncbi:MAG: hypothetical protein ACQERN_10895 [Thermodesulfobacteriota bacterium]